MVDVDIYVINDEEVLLIKRIFREFLDGNRNKYYMQKFNKR